ncbi:MAG TPA: mechanosensitive ion channel family protein [Longimicrobiales bacterium]|nr:mechanosensitive ion channel family protein [Longimicrobiales bacterium]
MSASLRLLAAGLLVLAPLAGCDRLGFGDDGTEDAAPAPVATDTAPAPPAAGPPVGAPGISQESPLEVPAELLDSLTDTAAVAARPSPPSSGGAVGATATAPQGSGPSTAGTGQDTTGLQARVARLEAVNDSLRSTILGLVALQGRPRPDSARRDSSNVAASSSEILEQGADTVRNWGLRIFFAFIFLALVASAVRLLVWILGRLAERNASRRLFYKRLGPVLRIAIWFLAALFTGLVILDLDAGGLIAAGAAGGVALGIAAQDILKNVFGGLIVLFDQPFQVGDKIRVGETYGEVVSIGIRSTRVVTPDDNLVTVPNAQIVEDQVANANAGELNCQVVTDLWLPGWVDEARAKEIAFEAATSSKYVFMNKPIVVLVKDEFDHLFLTHLKVKAYVLDPRYEFLFMSDVTERARAGFREAGLLPPHQVFDRRVPDPYDPIMAARWAWQGAGSRVEGDEAGASEALNGDGDAAEDDG